MLEATSGPDLRLQQPRGGKMERDRGVKPVLCCAVPEACRCICSRAAEQPILTTHYSDTWGVFLSSVRVSTEHQGRVEVNPRLFFPASKLITLHLG